jgi:hypothetical protein
MDEHLRGLQRRHHSDPDDQEVAMRYIRSLERASGIEPPKDIPEPEPEKPTVFRMAYWCQQADFAQSASNASGVMYSALRCLKEWRDTNSGDSNGSDCIPFRMMLYQVCDTLTQTCQLNDFTNYMQASNFMQAQIEASQAQQRYRRNRNRRNPWRYYE